MATPDPEASEHKQSALACEHGLERPGSSERRTNLWVRNPPYLGDEKARELEKGGLLSGLAPPSQILDGSMPLVELEANRLHEAMTWVYDSVQSLQKQSSGVETRLTSLQDLLQQLNRAPVDAAFEVTVDPQVDTESPASASTQSAGMRRMLQQLENKRAASEKLIEMRLDALKCDVDQRLQSKDLQEHKSSLGEQLESFQAKSREDIGAVGSMIHTESAAERRRIQAQLEVVTSRLTTQGELTEKLLQESMEKNSEAIQQFEARLKVVDELDPRMAALEAAGKASATAAAPKKPSAAAEEQGAPRKGTLSVSDEARVAYLEAGVSQLEARLKDLADQGSSSATEALRAATSAKSAENADSSLQDVLRRCGQLEGRVDRLDSSGSCGGASEGDDVHRQLVEVHRTHTEMHRQLLEVGVRLQQLEQGGLPGSGGGADPKTTMELATLATRVVKLENLNASTLQKVGDLDGKFLSEQRINVSELQRVQQDITTLVRYVTGENSLGSEGTPQAKTGQDGAQGEWPLAWLEKRVEALITKKGGMSLESRLQSMEKAVSASGSSDLGNRVKKLEQDFKGLDVKDLGRVRPDLTEYQRHQEGVSRELCKEMKELKVVVGCVEACIPRETRKAVQLFKRAAGSSEAPVSPREFAVESKILALREDMESQIQGATASLENGRDQMTVIVKGLEKKQELLECHLEDVRKNSLAGPQKGIPELPELSELRQVPGESA